MPFFLSSSCSAGGGISDERVSPSRCEGEGGFVGVQKRAARKGLRLESARMLRRGKIRQSVLVGREERERVEERTAKPLRRLRAPNGWMNSFPQ